MRRWTRSASTGAICSGTMSRRSIVGRAQAGGGVRWRAGLHCRRHRHQPCRHDVPCGSSQQARPQCRAQCVLHLRNEPGAGRDRGDPEAACRKDPALRKQLDIYRDRARGMPFGIPHFAMRYRSPAEIDAIEQRLAAHPVLSKRCHLRVTDRARRCGDADHPGLHPPGRDCLGEHALRPADRAAEHCGGEASSSTPLPLKTAAGPVSRRRARAGIHVVVGVVDALDGASVTASCGMAWTSSPRMKPSRSALIRSGWVWQQPCGRSL